jgi:hypothetical protein
MINEKYKTVKTFFAFIFAVILGIVFGMATATYRIAQVPWEGNPPMLSGESGGKLPAQPQKDLPSLVIDQDKFNFGSMDLDETDSHDFDIKNTGAVPLMITHRGTSCGCVSIDNETHEIPPGGSDKITVKWKSKEQLGPYKETVSFVTNDPIKTKFTLTITGKITARLRVIPTELIFDRISANETITRQARLLCYQDDLFEVLEHHLDAENNASNFQVDVQPLSAEQLKDTPDVRSGYLVKVTAKPGLPYGPFMQKIHIKTNLSYQPEIIIPMQGSILGDIRIAGPGWNDETGVLDLGIVNSRQGLKQRMLLVVRGPYSKEVKFKAIENPALPIKIRLGETAEINNGLATQTPLMIEIPSGSRTVNYLGKDSSDLGEIIIETTHPEMPKIRILVRFAVQN